MKPYLQNPYPLPINNNDCWRIGDQAYILERKRILSGKIAAVSHPTKANGYVESVTLISDTGETVAIVATDCLFKTPEHIKRATQPYGLPLWQMMVIMGEEDDMVVYIADDVSRTAIKTCLCVANARRKYGNRIVYQVRPYIYEDGEYVGNIYVLAKEPDTEKTGA